VDENKSGDEKNMIKSMTAFASLERASEVLAIKVEIKSYNSRHLDVFIKLPPEYATLEENTRALIAAHVHRGRLEVRARIRETVPLTSVFEIDTSRAVAYHRTLGQLKKMLNLAGPISLDQVLSGGSMIRSADHPRDLETTVWPPLSACLQETLVQLDAMRRKEGDAIAADFEDRLRCIDDTIEEIAASSGDMAMTYREKLETRIQALTGGLVELDPVRVTQEAAFLADRSDISEEIVRARSHVQQFRELMESDEPAGRKLNFLLQELNREFNTMGSKAGQVAVNHKIVEMKAELEKVREQVQNVE
jgi:uncharacterized protein (TIGR00255 family)